MKEEMLQQKASRDGSNNWVKVIIVVLHVTHVILKVYDKKLYKMYEICCTSDLYKKIPNAF